MFEETDSCVNTKSQFLQHFLQIFKNLEFTLLQNFYCDHRNFDSVNQS
jgi:hypothetical protein